MNLRPIPPPPWLLLAARSPGAARGRGARLPEHQPARARVPQAPRDPERARSRDRAARDRELSAAPRHLAQPDARQRGRRAAREARGRVREPAGRELRADRRRPRAPDRAAGGVGGAREGARRRRELQARRERRDPDRSRASAATRRPRTTRNELWRRLVHFQMSNYLGAGEKLPEAKRLLAHRYELRTKRLRELPQWEIFSIFLDSFATALDPALELPLAGRGRGLPDLDVALARGDRRRALGARRLLGGRADHPGRRGRPDRERASSRTTRSSPSPKRAASRSTSSTCRCARRSA